jgi:biopolymer transport protein ExbD
MHGERRPDDEPMAEMNFIPLIDIALTLVIILMVTTAFIRHPGVSLRLPETVTREGAPETKKDLIVAITKDGSIYLDGRKQDAPALQARLREAAARNREARILVKGDREVMYARVMDVMDMIRQAGLTRVVLPTSPKLPQEAAGPVVARKP